MILDKEEAKLLENGMALLLDVHNKCVILYNIGLAGIGKPGLTFNKFLFKSNRAPGI